MREGLVRLGGGQCAQQPELGAHDLHVTGAQDEPCGVRGEPPALAGAEHPDAPLHLEVEVEDDRVAAVGVRGVGVGGVGARGVGIGSDDDDEVLSPGTGAEHRASGQIHR